MVNQSTFTSSTAMTLGSLKAAREEENMEAKDREGLLV
jgi:hypothetical protein